MSSGKCFEQEPIAGLSGGKDCRIFAAAALQSGIATHLRTVPTEHCEVETASQPVELEEGSIRHKIKEVASDGNTKR